MTNSTYPEPEIVTFIPNSGRAALLADIISISSCTELIFNRQQAYYNKWFLHVT